MQLCARSWGSARWCSCARSWGSGRCPRIWPDPGDLANPGQTPGFREIPGIREITWNHVNLEISQILAKSWPNPGISRILAKSWPNPEILAKPQDLARPLDSGNPGVPDPEFIDRFIGQNTLQMTGQAEDRFPDSGVRLPTKQCFFVGQIWIMPFFFTSRDFPRSGAGSGPKKRVFIYVWDGLAVFEMYKKTPTFQKSRRFPSAQTPGFPDPGQTPRSWPNPQILAKPRDFLAKPPDFPDPGQTPNFTYKVRVLKGIHAKPRFPVISCDFL